MARRISSSVGRGFFLRKATLVISMPGVQYPHWSPCSAMKLSCNGWSLPSCSSPSTVVISRPWACTAKRVQDFTGRPSSSTVHAPQWLVSQPMWVPVRRRFSRIRCTRRRRGSTSASCFSPLIATLTSISGPFLRALDRLAERTGCQYPHQVLLVLDGAAQVRGRVGRLRRELGRLLDRGLVGPLSPQRGLRLNRLDRHRSHVGEADTDLLANPAAQGELHRDRRGGEIAHLALHLHVGAAAARLRAGHPDLHHDLVGPERGA